jgi:hypothetical protein
MWIPTNMEGAQQHLLHYLASNPYVCTEYQKCPAKRKGDSHLQPLFESVKSVITIVRFLAFLARFLLSTHARKALQSLPLTARPLRNLHEFGCGRRPRRGIRGVFCLTYVTICWTHCTNVPWRDWGLSPFAACAGAGPRLPGSEATGRFPLQWCNSRG